MGTALAARPDRCSVCHCGCRVRGPGSPPLCSLCRRKVGVAPATRCEKCGASCRPKPGQEAVCRYCRRRRKREANFPLRGLPCGRCGKPLQRSRSGFCGQCSSCVRCPRCGAAWGKPALCPACKVTPNGPRARGQEGGLKEAFAACPERQARIKRYTWRAEKNLPLFSERKYPT